MRETESEAGEGKKPGTQIPQDGAACLELPCTLEPLVPAPHKPRPSRLLRPTWPMTDLSSFCHFRTPLPVSTWAWLPQPGYQVPEAGAKQDQVTQVLQGPEAEEAMLWESLAFGEVVALSPRLS